MRYPGFVGGSYETLSRIVSGERTVNLYPTIVPFGNKAKGALYPISGLSDFATLVDLPGRGIFAEDGRLRSVFGETLYEVASDGTPTAVGPVLSDRNPATFSMFADELFITSGTKGYIRDLAGGGLTKVVDDVTMGGQVDTFFLGLDSETGEFKIAESEDGTTWDPTQVQLRSTASDRWQAMLTVSRDIFLFGEKTGEVWWNSGASPFPFTLRGGAFFEIGIEAKWSLAPLGATCAWLGRSKQGTSKVYWMNGYTPNEISNEAIEWAIQQYKDAGGISDAIGWSYERIGHTFYVLEFPSAGKTWVYDTKTNQWHERGRWSSLDNDFVPYRPRFHADCFGKNLICDGQAGKMYSFSESVFADVNGGELRRVRTVPHVSDENRRLFLDYIELECARGVGKTTGRGVDPLVMARASWDGGETWSNERTMSMGKKGQYGQRVRIDRWGSGRDLVMELVCTDPVPTYWFDLYVGIS